MEAQKILEYLIDSCIGENTYTIEQELENERVIKFKVILTKYQFGKIVGRGGRVAAAFREIVRGLTKNEKRKIFINFDVADGKVETKENKTFAVEKES